MMIYVDDILLFDSDLACIEETEAHLQKHFVTKDLGQPRFFFGVGDDV